VGFVILMGVALPLFGISLIAVLLTERLLLSRSSHLKAYLGLSASFLILTTASGCEPKGVEGGTKATVTVAGEPVIDVRVKVFSMQAGKPVEVGFAVSRADGKLEFVQPVAQGPLLLEPGEYRITAEPVGAPLVLPEEYGNPETTPLRIAMPASDGITLTLPAPGRTRN
jgi:hypothetical protein